MELFSERRYNIPEKIKTFADEIMEEVKSKGFTNQEVGLLIQTLENALKYSANNGMFID